MNQSHAENKLANDFVERILVAAEELERKLAKQRSEPSDFEESEDS